MLPQKEPGASDRFQQHVGLVAAPYPEEETREKSPLEHARVRLTLHPGQDGAKGLQAEYGDRLVCVRYRYDERNQRRCKTVELIVAEDKWTPVAPLPAPEQVVTVRVAAAEQMIRQQVKSAGGMWDAQRGVWRLRYDRVVALGLSNRIVVTNTF